MTTRNPAPAQDPAPRGPGRPPLPADQVGSRYQVYLRPEVAAAARERGDGSLSRGITDLVREAQQADAGRRTRSGS